MKLTVKKLYFFFLPLKYRSESINNKIVEQFLLISLFAYPVMYLLIDNVKAKVEYLPMTNLFFSIACFFIIFLILDLFSYILKKWKYYEPFLWFLGGIAILEISYLLLLMEYFLFLSKYYLFKQDIIFNFYLIIPIISLIISLVRYMRMIKNGKTEINSQKVISLEAKFKKTQITDPKYLKRKNSILYAAIIGVAFGGIVETSITFFLIIIFCVCALSCFVPRMFLVAYGKFKFPNQYSEKNLKKWH